MVALKLFLVTCFCVLMPAIAVCGPAQKAWNTPDMTKHNSRLDAMFEKTKTVCFGRFLVDVPVSAIAAWGEPEIPLGITVYPDGVKEVDALEKKFTDELKAEKAIYLNNVALLISVDDVVQPIGKIVTGYDGFEAIGDIKISGFFRWKNDAFIVDARPLIDRKEQVIENIKSIARRLRPHVEGDIPTEPGNCIEHAFLPDERGAKYDGELVRVGFRLKEFPDTHLSIFVRPSNPHYSDSDSLKWQLERLEKDMKAQDSTNPNINTKYLRRGARQVPNWGDGFEALSHTPELPEAHGFHDFAMDFRGVASDPLKPYLDVRMQTGVEDDVAGATKPSLTDEEAVAVWDKITSTIRVRPTKSVAAAPDQRNVSVRRPLGDLAATGRTCPETGWWESDEDLGAKARVSRHIKAGEIMPHAIATGEQSLWQKLKGKQHTYRMATTWKLISYDEPASPQTISANAALTNHKNGAAESKPNEGPSTDQKG